MDPLVTMIKLCPKYSTVLWSNGGEGRVGGIYLSLWHVQEVPQLNEDYQISSYLPGLIGVGDDGGGVCYALDYRTDPNHPSFVQVPFGNIDRQSMIILGDSFQAAIEEALQNRQ